MSPRRELDAARRRLSALLLASPLAGAVRATPGAPTAVAAPDDAGPLTGRWVHGFADLDGREPGQLSQGEPMTVYGLMAEAMWVEPDFSAAVFRLTRRRASTTARRCFQEPMTALNPLYTVGNQIAEVWNCTKPWADSRLKCNTLGRGASPALSDDLDVADGRQGQAAAPWLRQP